MAAAVLPVAACPNTRANGQSNIADKALQT